MSIRRTSTPRHNKQNRQAKEEVITMFDIEGCLEHGFKEEEIDLYLAMKSRESFSLDQVAGKF